MDAHYRKLNITLPDELLTRFETYCRKHGMRLSPRIAILIEQDMKRGSRRSPLHLNLSLPHGGHLKTGQLWTGQNRPVSKWSQA